MKQEFEKALRKNRNILKGIGIFEIVGGIVGLGLIIWLMLQGTETNTLVFLIMLIAVGFYVYSVFAGIRLFKKLEHGILHSRILQYLQIPAISIGGFTYIMTSGGYLLFGFDFTKGVINFSFALIASKFQLNILSVGSNQFLCVNLLAIFVLIILNKAHKKIQEQTLVKANYEQNINDWKEESNLVSDE
ncbi:hypothetical protein [Flagellimonas algicola]|uniref:Uncharacterized protein n=1 Tax=Flagellimonas algicola TaxID=2583815 RepID=A0ABY2WHW1_9FLAO|nr:hypothetical protein [Allomuricauda algicola]TMU50992.1 hypothetical protein FGG15_17365 [Allomuricauda algicola]